MPHIDTVFSQLLKLVPRHEFDRLAKEHHSGGRLRTMTRWSQFVGMVCGHVARRHSLRDVVTTLGAQKKRLYHLGVKPVTRTSFARVNADQPYTLYEALFAKLYARAQAHVPQTAGRKFRFKNKLYSLDASLIDLSLQLFPWSHYARGKGAVKLHMGLDHAGLMPAFAVITESRVMETTVAPKLLPRRGSIVVFDRGYKSFVWLKLLIETGVYFVTRLRAETRYEVVETCARALPNSVVSDQIIRLTGKTAIRAELPLMRLVTIQCPDTGKNYRFLTSIRHLAAGTIADIYKSRWEIELFFKFIKQNLKLKGFFGTTKNAVLTQIWTALCVCLIIAILRFSARIEHSYQAILRLLETNLFQRRSLLDLFKRSSTDPPNRHPKQLALMI